MDARDLFGDHSETLRILIDEVRRGIKFGVPVVVTADTDGKTATAQQALKENVRQLDTSLQQIAVEPFGDMPIHFPGGGGDPKTTVVQTHPVKKGDEGFVMFASKMINSWFENGGVQAVNDCRTHSCSDGMFVPNFRSKPRAIPNYNKDSFQTRSFDGKHTIDHHYANGTIIKTVDPNDNTEDPFNKAKKFFASFFHPSNGISHNATDNTGTPTTHLMSVTHLAGALMSAFNGKHTVTAHPSNGSALMANNSETTISASPGIGAQIVSTIAHLIQAPNAQLDSAGNLTTQTSVNSSLVQGTQGNFTTAAIGAISGFTNSGGGAGAGIGAGAMATGAAASNVGTLGGDLSGALPNPSVIGITHVIGANALPVYASNTLARAGGLAAGQLYLNTAISSGNAVLCVAY